MAKKLCHIPKFARQELMIQILQATSISDGLTTTELAERMKLLTSVCSRTILRDLNELSLRFPITEDNCMGLRRWKLASCQQNPGKLNLIRLETIEYLNQLIKTKVTFEYP